MKRSISDRFASGAVFDLSKQKRDIFINVLKSNDAPALLKLFIQSYSFFVEHPDSVGIIPQMINKENNDTDPMLWNADIYTLPNGDKAALLFMRIQHETLLARIVGIIFSDDGDGYYYCMLNKNNNIPSKVSRNMAMLGIKEIGEVKGLGPELRNSFLNCISNEFLSH